MKAIRRIVLRLFARHPRWGHGGSARMNAKSRAGPRKSNLDEKHMKSYQDMWYLNLKK